MNESKEENLLGTTFDQTNNMSRQITRCWHILKTAKNVTVVKFEVAFTRYRHNMKTIENSMAINSVQSVLELDAKEMYLHLKGDLKRKFLLMQMNCTVER